MGPTARRSSVTAERIKCRSGRPRSSSSPIRPTEARRTKVSGAAACSHGHLLERKDAALQGVAVHRRDQESVALRQERGLRPGEGRRDDGRLLLACAAAAPFVAVNTWYAWRGRERALANGLAAVVPACGMLLVATRLGGLGPAQPGLLRRPACCTSRGPCRT
ncbi:YwiC-like family protein [Streptomyces sp. NPDC058646]|uniref:YwiC-like family protein n=1 Tax=Streptomyces sp. NPDC058646 TaxID=3346574 RepID=UPI0036616664